MKPIEAVGENGQATTLWDSDPLEAARARGEKIGAELLATEGRPLDASKVSEILQITAEEVEKRRAAGSLLAVEGENNLLVFPPWQFTEHGLLRGFEEVLADLGNLRPWTQLQFFLNENLRLDGASPLAELRKGKVAEVRRAARNYGEQGAV